MEEIYVNTEYVKPDDPTPSTNCTGRRSFYFVLILSLGLLSVFLLVGLITLGVYYHVSSHDSAERLSAVNNQLSSMNEEKNQLTEKTKELKRLHCLASQNKTCPAGWRMFNYSCYLLSGSSGSWHTARKDCRYREADLVVIDSPEEQDFLTTFTQRSTWIGLNDTQEEGKWKWVDGTPLTLTYWATDQPDNGGGDPNWGEEDCAHIRNDENTLWNDISCANSLPWVCEKYHDTTYSFFEY